MRPGNIFSFLVSLCLGFAIAVPLFAQQASATATQRGLSVVAKELGSDAAIGRQYLILVGIDRYSDPAWPALRGPVKDCRELKAILTSRYVIDRTIELYDRDATSAGIYALLADLQKKLEPNDSLLLYYAGHGNLSSVTDVGYIVPADGGGTPGQGWISDAELRGWLRKVESRHVCLMLDSCFSGAILDDRRGMRPTIDSEYFRNAYARQSRQVLTSGASETVPDDSEFAYQLKAELKANTKPILDPLMIYNDIRTGMKRTQPLFGSVRDSGAQEGGSFLLFLKEASSLGDVASGQQMPETSKISRIQKVVLSEFSLPPGESVRAIISNPSGSVYTVITSIPQGILHKSNDYYIIQGTKKLGPFASFSRQENGAWIARGPNGQWYVGSPTSVTGPLPADTPPGWARNMEDKRLAFKVDIDGGGMYLQEGTLRPGTFDAIWGINPSPQDDAVAYVACEGNKRYVIVGKQSYGPFDGAGSPIWSPDGTICAFEAYISKQRYIYIDGEKKGPFNTVSDLAFAPDGKTLVFGADGFLIAANEKLGPFHGTPSNIVFAPNGGRFAFTVWEKGAGSIVHLDSGETYGPFSWGAHYSFSPDGKTFFCNGYEEKAASWVVYLDGERIVIGERSATTYPVFSREGKYKAFVVDVDWNHWQMHLGTAKFDIDRELPYGLLADGTPLYWTTRDDTHYLVIGNSEEGAYSAVADVSDAANYRFLACQGTKIVLLTCPR